MTTCREWTDFAERLSTSSQLRMAFLFIFNFCKSSFYFLHYFFACDTEFRVANLIRSELILLQSVDIIISLNFISSRHNCVVLTSIFSTLYSRFFDVSLKVLWWYAMRDEIADWQFANWKTFCRLWKSSHHSPKRATKNFRHCCNCKCSESVAFYIERAKNHNLTVDEKYFETTKKTIQLLKWHQWDTKHWNDCHTSDTSTLHEKKNERNLYSTLTSSTRCSEYFEFVSSSSTP